MKKALVLLLALSMVFGVFAAEPVANVNVSEFIMLDGIYDIPTGKVYIKNDTEYFLDFSTPDQAYHYDGFGPGQEIFFNPPESRTITWKVVE